jgi:hypothetical protein
LSISGNPISRNLRVQLVDTLINPLSLPFLNCSINTYKDVKSFYCPLQGLPSGDSWGKLLQLSSVTADESHLGDPPQEGDIRPDEVGEHPVWVSGYWVSRIGGQILLQVQLMTGTEKVAEEIKEIEATMAMAQAEMDKAKADQPGVPHKKNLPYQRAQERLSNNKKRLKVLMEGLSTTEDEAGPSNTLLSDS